MGFNEAIDHETGHESYYGSGIFVQSLHSVTKSVGRFKTLATIFAFAWIFQAVAKGSQKITTRGVSRGGIELIACRASANFERGQSLAEAPLQVKFITSRPGCWRFRFDVRPKASAYYAPDCRKSQ